MSDTFEVKEKLHDMREKRQERRRKRKERAERAADRRNSHYLWYKIQKRKDTWHPLAYYPAIIFAYIVESVRILFRFVVGLIFFLLTICAIGGVLFVILAKPTYDAYSDFAKEAVDNSTNSTFRIDESSIIYDNRGRVLANIHENADTEYLTYNEIPQDVVDAFVAIEDRTFWTNSGIDFKGIARVVYHAIKSEGDEVHGASTITQQLARNIFLSHTVSLERKGKEMLISLYLTEKYSKKDIMEFYCNDICFANGIYGIQGAAKAYFGKDVNRLSLKQIAYLCAIPNRPEYYNPYNDKTKALKRCEKILNDMYECGYITDNELAKAKAESITIEPQTFEFNDYASSYAIDCAVRYLMSLDEGFEFRYTFEDMADYVAYKELYNTEYENMRHKLYTGGYKIYTTIDKDKCAELQTVIDETLSFSDAVDEETGLYQLQGALTCIDTQTGKVVAVVGGRSQEKDDTIYSLNRAYQAYRQPGSTFKPLAVYTPAIELGWTPNSKVENIDVKKAKEKGADPQKMHGEVLTLRNAVERSLNDVAWQLFDRITPAYGMSYINNMQFAKICPDDFFNASALGGLTYGVTTVEMASGYCALANHGTWREATCIETIIAADGTKYKPNVEKEVYTSKAADTMVDILRGVLTQGTAAKLSWFRSSKIDAFGKTGTTNSSKDGWFCGATPYYTISVWVGYDMPKTLSNLYGATYPGQIWKQAMLKVTDGLEPMQFEKDTEDDSYKAINPQLEATGYYSYLEGRDDTEVLSDGYTVADYRTDRVIGEDVYKVITDINILDMSNSDSMNKLESLYSKGCGIIQQIYSRKYTAEMQGYLDAAYNAKKQGG